MGTVSVAAAGGRFAERPRLPLADEGGAVAEAEALTADPRTNVIPAIDDDDDREEEDITRVRDDVVAVTTALTAPALINMAVRYVSLLSVHIYYMRFR